MVYGNRCFLFPLGMWIQSAFLCCRGSEDSRRADQALGWSRGGFTTKIHAEVEGLGLPLRFILTPGQRHDLTQAVPLTDGFEYQRLVCDRSYDSSDSAFGTEIIIQPRSNRILQREYDSHIYKERHLIECFLNKLTLTNWLSVTLALFILLLFLYGFANVNRTYR